MYLILPCLEFFTLQFNYLSAIFWLMIVILFITLILRRR